MKKIGKPILAFILFLFIQGIVSVLAGVIALVTHRDALQSAMQGDGTALHEIVKQPTLLGLTLIVSSIVTILVIKGIGMMSFKNAFCSKGITLPNSLLAIIAAVTGIAATNIFSEMIDLPNIIEVQITSMSSMFLSSALRTHSLESGTNSFCLLRRLDSRVHILSHR